MSNDRTVEEQRAYILARIPELTDEQVAALDAAVDYIKYELMPDDEQAAGE